MKTKGASVTGQAGESFTDFVFAKLTDYFITSFCPKNDNENLQTKNGNPNNSGIQIMPALRCEHYQCCPFACQNIVGPSWRTWERAGV